MGLLSMRLQSRTIERRVRGGDWTRSKLFNVLLLFNVLHFVFYNLKNKVKSQEKTKFLRNNIWNYKMGH